MLSHDPTGCSLSDSSVHGILWAEPRMGCHDLLQMLKLLLFKYSLLVFDTYIGNYVTQILSDI